MFSVRPCLSVPEEMLQGKKEKRVCARFDLEQISDPDIIRLVRIFFIDQCMTIDDSSSSKEPKLPQTFPLKSMLFVMFHLVTVRMRALPRSIDVSLISNERANVSLSIPTDFDRFATRSS